MKVFTLSALLLGSALASQAQAVLPLIKDTTGYVKGGYGKATSTFYQGIGIQADGIPLRAYWPASQAGFEKAVDFFYAPPTKQSRSPRETIKVAELQSLSVHGRYYEKMQPGGKATSILALRVVDGPVELFLYAEARTIPVPVPGVGMSGALVPRTLPLGNYTNNLWFVRRKSGELTKVSRSHFAEQMRDYLSDQPALVQKITADDKDYRYQDMLAIISEYNQQQAASQK